MKAIKKKEIVNFFLQKYILINPDFLNSVSEDFNKEDFNKELSEKISSENFLVLINELNNFLDNPKELNWKEFDNAKVLFEKEKNRKPLDEFIRFLKQKEQIQKQKYPVKVLFTYKGETKKREIQDFVTYFNARYKSLEKLLRYRQELQNVISINKIKKKKDKENISLIGIVSNKSITKNGNLMLEIEDSTASIKVLISKNKPELLNQSLDIVLDEIIGISGVNGDNIVFANDIIWPDIPLNKEFKKAPDQVYAVVISDLHIGSNQFLPEKFNHFLQWINCRIGNEKQKEIASKVKYIFLVGDLIDGIGVYPGQEEELIIKDVYQQYEECARLIKQIPPHISLIICPGNHDAMRIAEPQPEIYKDFAKSLWELPNITMVSNPSLVNIHSSSDFPGFDVLLYHGYSFDYYVANVDSIRNQGGYDRADLIMKFLLKRRHLAPTHSSTLYIPDVNEDPLVINKIPDFFITGHIHKSSVSNYRNITMICSSCWQSKTPFQEKVGHHPEPARVPIINLQTREVKILKF